MILIVLTVFLGPSVSAQTGLRMVVYRADDGKLLDDASITMVSSGKVFSADETGMFNVPVGNMDTAVVSHVGYVTQRLAVDRSRTTVLKVYLAMASTALDEVVVNTGYYHIPKERATGSFVHIDNKMINRTIGRNILERLESVAPGVQFTNPGGTPAADIRIRGLATIESDETPLIVLDNFPYEGSLDNIDPNDIESITVLKDAAAASIWGAKAGNGVIVITTKRLTKKGRTQISLNANMNMSDKPDLFYAKDWLPSSIVMDFEKERYDLGQFAFGPRNVNPLFVERLKQYDDGLISSADWTRIEADMRRTDTRAEAQRHLYRRNAFQQYAINVAGGSDKYRYHITGGYHRTLEELVGNDSRRINIGTRQRFVPHERVDISLGVAYLSHTANNNGISYRDLAIPYEGISPYLKLRGEDGRALPVVKDISYRYALDAASHGLLDWTYRPLDELALSNRTESGNELRLNADISVGVSTALSARVSYQYTRGNSSSETIYDKDSYYARNLVNRYTQSDGSRVLPYAGVYQRGTPSAQNAHFGRAQLNFDRQIDDNHQIHALAGAEVRQSITEVFPASVLYNYNSEYQTGSSQYNFNTFYPTLPGDGRALRIPDASYIHGLATSRDLSYFSNASYAYKSRYTFSASVRWDGSNLFGVKANQKGVPLWSVGAGWKVSDEPFYGQSSWFPYLRIRATYGVSGNVNKSVTHYPTIRHTTAAVTGLPTAYLLSVGNPALKWEEVMTSNVGLDWRMLNGRISGTIELYKKKGEDLIGDDVMDPTTGIKGAYKINYANIETRGADIQLTSQNIKGRFTWNTTLFSSWVKNKVTNFNTNERATYADYLTTTPPPVVGVSRDAIYAIPWHGLSHETGLPIIYMEGEESTTYSYYTSRYLTPDRLVDSGVRVPLVYGSVRNTLAWQGIELDVMIAGRFGHLFRRSSMSPVGEMEGMYHQDYYDRWKNPGDEQFTNVPAGIPFGERTTDHSAAGSIYRRSETLLTKGDVIRLRDIRISYALPKGLLDKIALSNVVFSAYMKNVGIIWTANRHGIDPDFPSSTHPAPRSYAFGVQLNF
ncbi:SusC/RagA family TonB-linked outer membrane protein [Parapedobacter sp. 10938]|uniref:SusC/RagA family TonB-linked outer membrane protein n=1 Tax=Parapedobacter flavus TaxID=3110225 RepID=UPI002DBA1D5F|nr:SusC/RagA family TonB-linked outer membrane protein [Parapedobacter sp. 10938]MEC3881914.1 SusC/RagA family TonB-linked outer membrane protein [Parapedobacter sp. 10938]